MAKTSFAISSGLNYTPGISHDELRVSGNGKGSNLMHVFSPKTTRALPDKPEQEHILRVHHRSGFQGDGGLPGFAIFNDADTGAT